MTTEHTPAPWKWLVDPFTQRRHIESAEGLPVATVASEMELLDPEAMSDEPAIFERQKEDARSTIDANAEHIVRCVNAHDDLLAALHKIDSNAAENPEWIRRVAKEAIAKAEGVSDA